MIDDNENTEQSRVETDCQNERLVMRGYWYCDYCGEEVDIMMVTYTENHDRCGHPVDWIDPKNCVSV